ncbi:MAG: superoxide dismutase [Paraprevotella sp.]|nr:superoxide dismutase [Paraprevotella sp.]
MLTQLIITSMTAPFALPALPYESNALEPVISKETIEYHNGKHLQAYVNTLNTLVKGMVYEKLNLEEIVSKAPAGPLANNAGQVLNHTLYFEQFHPVEVEKSKVPEAQFDEAIRKAFGSFDVFKEKMAAASTGLFGSGWAWLEQNRKGNLVIVQCPNAGNPVTEGLVPLLGFDVWEHAYYIDYRNRRPDHIAALWQIVDWDVVSSRMK